MFFPLASTTRIAMTFRRLVFAAISGMLLISTVSASRGPGDASVEERVKKLLQSMTLEEKVGQMTQVTIDVVSAGRNGRREPHALDPKKLESAVVDHHVGSIINVGPAGYDLAHWRDVIRDIESMSMERTRLKIPVLYGIDAIHGVSYINGGTLFPQAINVGASFDRELARTEGTITAEEMRASGIPWNFFPVLDVGRQPLWPRLWETFGEDAYLVSELGRSYIQGHQGNDVSDRGKGATCLKHYAGYSFPYSGKDRTAAMITERMMRETFLPPFEEAVRAGAMTVMVNSGEVDGIPGHANHHLLTEVLKGEMKFSGFVVSDWQDIIRLHTRDKVASTPEEAVRIAVMAGVDMSMVPYDFSFYDLLLKCVDDGSVPISRIDDAVTRILRVKMQLGLFEHPYADPTLATSFADSAHTAANLAAAEQSIVLAQNDGVLPLSKTARVLVTGPTADLLSTMNGGWTITWQGNEESRYPKDKQTPLAAIRSMFGADRVVYVPGTDFARPLNIQEAVDSAKMVDAVIVCLGEKSYCETPGNLEDLTLDNAQLDLARAVAGAGKPVVLVLFEGRPRIIRTIADQMNAVLVAFLPGMEGGRALARLLVGDALPCARLPVSYPRFPNALTSYDYKPQEIADGNTVNPQWTFGHGLSYTTFSYSQLKLERDAVRRGETLGVSVRVKNSGTRRGAEIVLLYVRDEYSSVTRPVRQLKGFQKVLLAPGEEREVAFSLDDSSLSFIGANGLRLVEPGAFTVMVGPLSTGFTLK
jgi:beta-glucosidase